MMITLLSSGIAGIGGLFFGLNPQFIGGLALFPGVIAVVATTLNPQGRANWHYRKTDGLAALRRKLLFELPESPTAENVASVSQDWTKLTDHMNVDWERNFALNWSRFLKRDDPKLDSVNANV
jgi:hypothetical protein